MGTEKTKLDRNLSNNQTVLYDENIFIDSELYRKWDRNLSFED